MRIVKNQLYSFCECCPSGLSLDLLDMGGGQSVNGEGGLMRGDIELMLEGPNFDRSYHKLKVLLLLLILL